MLLRKTMAAVLISGGLAGSATAAEDAFLLAEGCAGCHGQAGEGQYDIAHIAGYDREAFLRVWAEFRANERPATIMNRIAPGYTDEEVAKLADYFSSIE